MKARIKYVICAAVCVLAVSCSGTGDGNGSSGNKQIMPGRIAVMPDMPSPYLMRNWKKVVSDYTALLFDVDKKGEYLPLTSLYENGINSGGEGFYQKSYVGDRNIHSAEAVNSLAAIVGATLCGMNMQNYYDRNWVAMSENFYNGKNGLNIYCNKTKGSPHDDWWYELIPNVLFYQLCYLYPRSGNFKEQSLSVADRWLACADSLKGTDMNFRAFDFSAMKPVKTGVPEPAASGAMGWLLYSAYISTGKTEYLSGAESCMSIFSGQKSNPAYELQFLYGTVAAARMNAELGTRYDLEKIMRWCFDLGTLRAWRHLDGWGVITGRWGTFDVSGLVGGLSGKGNTEWGDYAFLMNTFQQIGILAPVARYQKEYASAIGKYILNAANACRLFYSGFVPDSCQDKEGADWCAKYDPHSCIAYEALRQYYNGKSPYATGDATLYGWNDTNLSLYSSSSVGYAGAVIDTTDVKGILKIDLLKTDFYHGSAYPTFLYYNPYEKDKEINTDLGKEKVSVYDAVAGRFIAKDVSGTCSIPVPARSAVVGVYAPAGGRVSREKGKLLVDGVVVDYN
ncbi:MAG: hypothetical protein LKI53_05620 [Bacteroidales bacterium]|jgi:hypothetical protein|nr:hypothetical protein [Bacteroidales bacterium]